MNIAPPENYSPAIRINGKRVDKDVIAASVPATKRFRPVRQPRKPVVQSRVISQSEDKKVIPQTVMEPVIEPIVPTINESPPIKENVEKPSSFTISPARVGETPISIDLSKIPIPDFDAMTEQERDSRRAELILKLNIIRGKQTGYELPNYAQRPDISLKELYLADKGFLTYMAVDKTIGTYKVYWILGCIILELICTHLLKFKFAKNFANVMIKNSLDTEMLLVEMGCESVAQNGVEKSQWPHEVRIAFGTILTFVIFVVVKLFLGLLGVSEEKTEGTVSMILDYAYGRKALPTELTSAVTKGVTENPGNALGGIMSNLNFASLGPMLGALMGGNNNPTNTTASSNTTYNE